jgi:hypothetical protein
LCVLKCDFVVHPLIIYFLCWVWWI